MTFAHGASFGTKDFASAPDNNVLSLGEAVCTALGGTPSVDYPDVLTGLMTGAGGPSHEEADALARSAVTNLCPQYASHLP